MPKPLTQVKNTPVFKIAHLFRRQITVLFLLSLVSSCLLLIIPQISRSFIDNVFLKKIHADFFRLAFSGAFLFLGHMAVNAARDLFKNRANIKLKIRLNNRLIRKFYAQDMEFFQARSVGENAYLIFDSDGVCRFILEDIPAFALDLIKLPVIFVVCLWLSPRVVFLLFFLTPLFVFRSVYIQKKLRGVYRQLWQRKSLLSKEIAETFARITIIKSLGLESVARHAYLRLFINSLRWESKAARWFIAGSLSSTSLSRFAYGVIALYGGWLIVQGRLSLGTYTAVMFYIMQLGAGMESLGQRLSFMAERLTSIEKFNETLSSSPRIIDAEAGIVLKQAKGEIEFRDVSFGYEKNKFIFKNLNMRIPVSSWVAIAGSSGCGKTTLVNLILRLYDPLEGDVLLDGTSLKEIKLKSLRETMAVAAQQPFLFDLSVGENIKYGLRHISQGDVEEAARIACLHDFVKQLPQRLDTAIGEDAFRLSHGLKQRVAIARAVARKPRILILDEAASSVDMATERIIFENLKQQRQGLTTLIITHRLSSILDADKIYFLKENGEVEGGCHSELMQQSLAYKAFLNQKAFLEVPMA